jgi:hypothetical protein
MPRWISPRQKAVFHLAANLRETAVGVARMSFPRSAKRYTPLLTCKLVYAARHTGGALSGIVMLMAALVYAESREDALVGIERIRGFVNRAAEELTMCVEPNRSHGGIKS